MLSRDFALNQWVPALRSGKYNQTKAVLHDEVGFCCLGVACDVIGMKWLTDADVREIYALEDDEFVDYTGDSPSDHYYLLSEEDNETTDTSLPIEVVSHYGFHDSESLRLPPDMQSLPIVDTWFDRHTNKDLRMYSD